jgi:hypothetical protein
MAEDNRGYWVAEVAELFEDELVRFLLPLPMGCSCCLRTVPVMCMVPSAGADLRNKHYSAASLTVSRL